MQSTQGGGANIVCYWSMSWRQPHTCGTINRTHFIGVESTCGQPDWEIACEIKNPTSDGDRERSWSGGAVLVKTGWDVVGKESAINSRQGGVFTDSWKALGCWTGTCQMQLLLWLIDRVCIPPWWETRDTSQCWEWFCQFQKEEEKTIQQKRRKTKQTNICLTLKWN